MSRGGTHVHISKTNIPGETTFSPYFSPIDDKSSLSENGGFTRLMNRVLEWGYWARLSDLERNVYIAISHLARFCDQFEAEFAVSEVTEITGLTRQSVGKAITSLCSRGLLEELVAGRGRRKQVVRILMPLKPASETGQSDATEQRRNQKAAPRKRQQPLSKALPYKEGRIGRILFKKDERLGGYRI